MQQELLTDLEEILTKAKDQFTSDKISVDALSAADIQDLGTSLSLLVNTQSFKPMQSHLPGAIDRLELNRESDVDAVINVKVLGLSNCGKTQMWRRTMSDAVAERVGRVTLPNGLVIEDILGSANMADKTKAIIRVPINNVVLWDTPGLCSDRRELDSWTRALFNLEMLSDDPVSHIPVINTGSSPASYEEVPIEEIFQQISVKYSGSNFHAKYSDDPSACTHARTAEV